MVDYYFYFHVYTFEDGNHLLVISKTCFTCLLHFCLQEQAEPKPHLFPFLVDNSKSLLGTMYRQVHTTMIKLHAGKGSIEDLVKIASGR